MSQSPLKWRNLQVLSEVETHRTVAIGRKNQGTTCHLLAVEVSSGCV